MLKQKKQIFVTTLFIHIKADILHFDMHNLFS